MITLKEFFKRKKWVRADDSGNVAQVVILIAGFVMVAILLITWLGMASLNKGADMAQCVELSETNNYAPDKTGLMFVGSNQNVACGAHADSATSAFELTHAGVYGGAHHPILTPGGTMAGTFKADNGFRSRYS